jgi:hypothetical protein
MGARAENLSMTVPISGGQQSASRIAEQHDMSFAPLSICGCTTFIGFTGTPFAEILFVRLAVQHCSCHWRA